KKLQGSKRRQAAWFCDSDFGPSGLFRISSFGFRILSEVTICLGRVAFFAKLQARMKSSTRPVSESPTPVDASAWFTAGRFTSLLGVLILVAFPEVATGRRTFVFGGFGVCGCPLAY